MARNSLSDICGRTLVLATLLAFQPALDKPAFAQTSGTIEEIVVTAQKREQSLQDVPIAVSAFTAGAIEDARIDDLLEIAVRTPNFNIGMNGPSAPELTIRGIGSSDREAGSDRSVVVFVDEVYIGRAGASTFDMFDLERIEVLRGPQGSIFGRNVVGGSVNLITADPKFERETRFEASIGSLNLIEAKGMLTGPLSDTLAGRLAVSYRDRDGYYRNRLFDSRRTDDSEAISARAKLLFQPSDAFDLMLTAEVSSDDVDGVGSAITQGETSDDEFFGEFNRRFGGGSLPDAALLGSDPDAGSPFLVDNNEFGLFERNIAAFTLRADWHTDLGAVTFLQSYRDTSFEIIRDVVGIPIGGDFVQVAPETVGYSTGRGFESTAINDEDYRAVSTEVRIASNPASDSPLSWLLGLYHLTEEIDRIQIRERQLGGTISRPRFDQSNSVDSTAAFGQVRWQVADRLAATFGARYTRDNKDFALGVTDTLDAAARGAILALIPGARIGLSPAASVFNASASDSFDELTPEGTVDFYLAEHVMTYVKVSTGFKSGGFVGLGANATFVSRSFEPETVRNVEAGFKGEFLDRRLRLNANGFWMEFDDLQLRDRQLLIPGDETSAIVTTVNAAKAEINGLEADFLFRPVPELSVSGSLAVLDTEITEVAEGSTIRLGTVLPRAPEFSANWAMAYTLMSINGGSLTLGGEIQYVGSLFYDINEDTAGAEPSVTLLDARVSYSRHSGNWSVSVWAKNLMDNYYRTQVQSVFGDDVGIISRIGEPRTYGVSVQVDL